MPTKRTKKKTKKKSIRKKSTNSGLPSAPSMPDASSVNAMFMFFGVPDIGKTTFAERLAPGQTFFLSFDMGTEFMDTMRANISNYAQFDKQLKLLETANLEGALEYQQIVVDHIDAMALICEQSIIDKYNKEKGADVVTLGDTYAHGKSWDMYEKLLRRVFARLAKLGVPITYLAHEDEKEKPVNGVNTVVTQPRMDKRTWKVFLPLMHICGRIFWKKVKIGKNRKFVRVLQTVQQSDDLITKDKTNRLKPDRGWEKIDTEADVQKFLETFEV